MRVIAAKLDTGIIPGTISAVIPAAATASRNRKKVSGSKKNWVIARLAIVLELIDQIMIVDLVEISTLIVDQELKDISIKNLPFKLASFFVNKKLMIALIVEWCGVLPVKAEDGVFGDELEQPPLQLSGKRRHPGLGDAGHVGLLAYDCTCNYIERVDDCKCNC